MTTLLTLELIQRCHEGSKAKGFWPEGNPPPQGQQLMLVISELAEALEADRKGNEKKDGLARYAAIAEKIKGGEEAWAGLPVSDFYPESFQGLVKDSVGDEVADAYIRLCDYVGGYNLDSQAVIDANREWGSLFGGAGQSLGCALLSVSHTVACAWTDDVEPEWPLGCATAELEALAERFSIDLTTHIDLKLRYNATRPAKHGKAY